MKDSISKKQLREFGLIIAFGIPFFIGWLQPFIFGHEFRYWTLFFGLFSIFISFLKPTLFYYFYKFWIKLGFILGWINSRIILGLIFIFVVIPISLIMKSTGYDPLNIKKYSKETYREDTKKNRIDFRRIF